MKYFPIILMASTILVVGCKPSIDTSVYYKEWEEQQKRFSAQLDDYDRQSKHADEQARRFDQLLDKWEEQARRYDIILEKMEEQQGIQE